MIGRILLVIFILVLSSAVYSAAVINSDIDIIRERILEELLASEVDDSSIQVLVESIRTDGSWPGINYEDVSRTRYEHRIHVANLLSLSVAYRKSGSTYLANADVKQTFKKALDFWIEHDFIADNWHTNEIANPRNWTAILFLMDDELSESQRSALVDMAGRANFNAWGARPGGDQIKIAGIAAELAVFLEDEETLIQAVEIMANEVQISSGNGIKRDLGFHHRVDRVTSILAYGTGYATAFADWAVRLNGTSYNFPEETIRLVVDFYLDGICKSMVYGHYKDPGSMNRGISRKGYLKAIDSSIPQNLADISDYRKEELETIVNIRDGVQSPQLTSNTFFWHSEYLSHQRPDYFTSVRMYSERNHNMEFPHNMESLKMHHYADGSNFISIIGQEYYDIFAVWDWQKIPGTTVVQKEALPSYREIVKWGKSSFVGAATDGKYGMATFDFDSPHDDLKAQKAWFFFDDEFVCLGAGINSNAEDPIATTINQCLLEGEVISSSNSSQTTLKKGDHSLQNTSWVHHNNVAYLFPDPVDVSVENKMRSGEWSSISKSAWTVKEGLVEKDVFSLWLDHGKKPENDSYQYIVRPSITSTEVDAYSQEHSIRVLSNTSEIQAVQNANLDITQIVFYTPASITLPTGLTVTADQPILLMINGSGREVKHIAVADPTRDIEVCTFKLSKEITGNGVNWSSVWNKKTGTSELTVHLPQDGLAGKSVVVVPGDIKAKALTQVPKGRKFEAPRNDGKRYIGEKYGGGVIVWLDEKREHGLIAATEDSEIDVPWENGRARVTEHYGDRYDRVTNARGNGIGAGQMNTMLIVSQQTEDRFFGNFAAKVAVECTLGGYGDWYLPSMEELGILHDLKDEIGGFAQYMYWSSTEYNVGFAWGQSFKHYKSEYTFNKGSRCAVRCVRKF